MHPAPSRSPQRPPRPPLSPLSASPAPSLASQPPTPTDAQHTHEHALPHGATSTTTTAAHGSHGDSAANRSPVKEQQHSPVRQQQHSPVRQQQHSPVRHHHHHALHPLHPQQQQQQQQQPPHSAARHQQHRRRHELPDSNTGTPELDVASPPLHARAALYAASDALAADEAQRSAALAGDAAAADAAEGDAASGSTPPQWHGVGELAPSGAPGSPASVISTGSFVVNASSSSPAAYSPARPRHTPPTATGAPSSAALPATTPLELPPTAYASAAAAATTAAATADGGGDDAAAADAHSSSLLFRFPAAPSLVVRRPSTDWSASDSGSYASSSALSSQPSAPSSSAALAARPPLAVRSHSVGDPSAEPALLSPTAAARAAPRAYSVQLSSSPFAVSGSGALMPPPPPSSQAQSGPPSTAAPGDDDAGAASPFLRVRSHSVDIPASPASFEQRSSQRLLRVEEVLEFSPSARQMLDDLEAQTDSMRLQVSNVAQSFSTLTLTGRSYSEAVRAMIERVRSFASPAAETDASNPQDAFLLHCCEGLDRIEEMRQVMLDAMRANVVDALDDFVEKEFRDLKERRKQMVNVKKELDTAIAKYNSSKRSKQTDMEPRVKEAKRHFELGSLDYVGKLNEVESAKHTLVLDRIAYAMSSMHEFYERATASSRVDVMPLVHSLASSVEMARSSFIEERARLQDMRASIMKEGASPLTSKTTRMSVATTPLQPRALAMSGYLFKQSHNFRRDWRRRWFEIRNGMFYYYGSGKDDRPKRVFNLMLATVRSMDEPKVNCFEVKSHLDESIRLQAESADERQAWIDAIQATIATMLDKGNEVGSRPESGSFSAVLSLLYSADDSNRVCADCGRPDPEWVSINCCVRLCIECSGVHRSLGVHHSKVRSLKLDKLDNAVQQILFALPNVEANKVWEATYLDQVAEAERLAAAAAAEADALESDAEPAAHPAEPGPPPKPSPDSSTAERQRFVRAKYVERRFTTRVVPSSVPSEVYFGNTLCQAASQNSLKSALSSLAHEPEAVNYVDRRHAMMRPIHFAAASGNMSVAQLLMLWGSRVDVPDAMGLTPLMWATKNAQTSMVAFLLAHKADVGLRNSHGLNAYDMAIQEHLPVDVQSLLRAALEELTEAPPRISTDVNSTSVASNFRSTGVDGMSRSSSPRGRTAHASDSVVSTQSGPSADAAQVGDPDTSATASSAAAAGVQQTPPSAAAHSRVNRTRHKRNISSFF